MKYITLISTLVLIPVAFCLAQMNTTKMDSMIARSAVEDSFEGTILIADRGEIVLQRSFGYKDAKKEQRIGDDTKFGIASITKMITAIIVLQLVEEGEFKLTDNLQSLLPSIKIPNADKITVHHLLLHISGLPNEDDLIYLQPKTPGEFVLETIGKKKKLKGFGKFNYANIDYVLLGLIIESVEEKSWQESVRERMIDKLALSNTGFLAKGNYPENFAYSYSFDEQGERKSDPLFHIENFYAAGCMYSTAEDLLKIDQAMYGQKLLKEETKETMFKSYPEYNYSGYSVWTYRYPFVESRPRIMERRGGILGSNSVLVRILESNQTIVILSNNNQFNPDSFGNQKNLKEALIMEVAK